MADNIEYQDKGELVANCDQLQNDEVVVTTPVESRIMSIRGKQIMIDRDLAELYGVETRVLNQAVKRNMERFPERFRFQLTKEEMNELVTNCDRDFHAFLPHLFYGMKHFFQCDTLTDCLIRRILDYRAIRHRIGKRHPKLDQIHSGLLLCPDQFFCSLQIW